LVILHWNIQTCSVQLSTYSLFCSDFNDTWNFSRQGLETYSNIIFYENPTSGSRVFRCGQMDGRTDMSKIIVASRNFANAPKNGAAEHATDDKIRSIRGVILIPADTRILPQLFTAGTAQSVQWLATGCTARGSNPGGGEICTCPDRVWGPTSLLWNGYRFFPGDKAAGAWLWPPTPNYRRG
jgi:hypothetical protein